MDFEDTLQMVDHACAKLYGLNRIDRSEVMRSATQIYLANLPRKNLLKRLQEAKERIGGLTYCNACDDGTVDLDDVFEILDELMEVLKNDIL